MKQEEEGEHDQKTMEMEERGGEEGGEVDVGEGSGGGLKDDENGRKMKR